MGSGGSGAASGSATSGRGDTVTMSALGERLTGAAADLFSALDTKARGMLEDFVNSGKMSADEVVKGLNAIAKNAAMDSFVVNGLEKSGGRPGFSEAIVKAGQVTDDMAGQRRALNDAVHKGDISSEDYMNKVAGLTETAAKRRDDIMAPFAGTVGKPIVLETGGKPIEQPSDSEQAALDKLAHLGFDKLVYRDGASAYASKFRLSSDQAPTLAEPPAGQGGGAASTSAQSASAVTVSVTSTTTTASAATAASPASALDSQVAAGQAAASMLQAALDGGAKPTSSLFSPASAAAGSAGADGGGAASSLLQALKDGAAKDGED